MASPTPPPRGSCLIENARLLTLAPTQGERGPRRGARLNDLGIIERGWIATAGSRIGGIGSGDAPDAWRLFAGERRVNAQGRVVLPAFVDCHTHACWTGDRYDEAAMKLAGREYLDILASGGGIMSTVRSVRASAVDDLAAQLTAHLGLMRASGTGAIEVKSGYGLSVDAEMRMLEAITQVAASAGEWMPPIVPTFLGAHAIPSDDPAWVDACIEMLPRVVERFGRLQCDAYCERGAWDPQQCAQLFTRARALSMPCSVHVDQFHALGFLSQAIALGVRSVAHLEASTANELELAAQSDAVGIFLPGSGLHLDLRFANARRFIAQGGAPAIATNCNPGSSPLYSMPLVIALATRFLQLTYGESICAATWNAAAALGLETECGALVEGYRGDLLLLPIKDERALAHEYESGAPELVMLGGREISPSPVLPQDAA